MSNDYTISVKTLVLKHHCYRLLSAATTLINTFKAHQTQNSIVRGYRHILFIFIFC